MLKVIMIILPILAATKSGATNSLTPEEAAAVGAAMSSAMTMATILSIILLAVIVVTIIGTWKIFTKAGVEGWKCIIPFYNMYVMTELCWKKGWFWAYLILCFCCAPVGAIIGLVIYYKLGKAFGQSSLFCVGMALLSPIFVCILGFGQAKYIGNPYNEDNDSNNTPPTGPTPPSGEPQPPIQTPQTPNQGPVPGTTVPPVGQAPVGQVPNTPAGQPPIGQPPVGQPPVPPAPQGTPQPPAQNF